MNWELELVLGLVLEALLVSFLYFKHWQRVYRRYQHYDRTDWTANGLDVAQIKPRLQSVRADYLSTRKPAQATHFHVCLIAVARHAVLGLNFFRARNPEEQQPSPSVALGVEPRP